MSIFRRFKHVFKVSKENEIEDIGIGINMINIGTGSTEKSPYGLWLDNMKKEGWERGNLTLTQNNRTLSEVYSIDSEIYIQRILSITCPAGQVMSICGLNQSGISAKEFKENPMLYSMPHMFSIECGEMGDDVNIDILKLKPSSEIYMITTEYYKDLSLWEGSRCKRKGERYFFDREIVLYGMESLQLRARKPDVNVSSRDISFILKCDIFTKRY